jgi:hypothetical protein
LNEVRSGVCRMRPPMTPRISLALNPGYGCAGVLPYLAQKSGLSAVGTAASFPT